MVILITYTYNVYNIYLGLRFGRDFFIDSIKLVNNGVISVFVNLLVFRPIGLVNKILYIVFYNRYKENLFKKLPIPTKILIIITLPTTLVILGLLGVTRLYIDVSLCAIKCFRLKEYNNYNFFVELINKKLAASLIISQLDKQEYTLYVVDKNIYLNGGGDGFKSLKKQIVDFKIPRDSKMYMGFVKTIVDKQRLKAVIMHRAYISEIEKTDGTKVYETLTMTHNSFLGRSIPHGYDSLGLPQYLVSTYTERDCDIEIGREITSLELYILIWEIHRAQSILTKEQLSNIYREEYKTGSINKFCTQITLNSKLMLLLNNIDVRNTFVKAFNQIEELQQKNGIKYNDINNSIDNSSLYDYLLK